MVGGRDTITNATVGASVLTVSGFIPAISAIIGGAVAGYLQDDGARGGTKAGFVEGGVATLPYGILAVVAGGMVDPIPILGDLLVGSVVVIIAFLFLCLVFFGVTGGLIGGYIADEMADERKIDNKNWYE
jgi:hypothetical protein